MKIIEAPNSLDGIEGKSLFLAGSIEMGTAVEWQKHIIAEMANVPGTILNPRRSDWDPSWEQKITNPKFVEQVTWELDALERADIIVFYFDPNTKSPITLMELGLFAKSDKPLYACCPDGFWRKGNVDILCARYTIAQFSSLSSLTNTLRYVSL
jgi:hypothetical protein